MKGDRWSELFQHSSRVIIVLPFVVILLVLVSRYQVFNTSAPQSEQVYIKPSVTSSITMRKPQIDFNQDVVCEYEDKTATISAYMKVDSYLLKQTNKKETSYYLAQGDCLYMWKVTHANGQKMCDIGRYVQIGKSLVSSGFFDMNSIGNYLPKTIPVKEVVSACRNKMIDEKVFTLPKNIRFVEEKK